MCLGSAVLLMTGCLSPADSPTTAAETPTETPTSMTREQGIKALEGMGFDPARIQPTQTGFLVEGDMAFRLKDMESAGPLAKTSQRGRQAVSIPLPNTLTLAIHSSMSDWKVYVHQAVNSWNALNTRLHIEVVPSGGNITIFSDADPSCPSDLRNLPTNTLGAAPVAAGGYVGPEICINKDGYSMQNTGVRVAVILHEMGHTLAFFHTDNASDPLIPGTPTSDAKSIMNAVTPENATGNFTSDDIKAIEIQYPSVKPLGGSDMDWDRKDDIVAWRPRDGMWYYLASSRGFASGYTTQWGQNGDMPMADMDMDGDGKDDFVTWRPSDGYWRAKLSTGSTRSIQWGQVGDIPISNHDMDGDGKDDLVVWRWSEGKFFVLTSRSNFTSGAWYGWGQVGDIPVGGIDADKDGKDDWVVWRPSENIFYVEYSGSGFTTSSWFGWGQAGDIPMGSIDLDRDNYDDLTIWRPGNGTWYSRTSGSNFNSGLSTQWGVRGDVPLVGTDIDQDGKRDIVVWRPGTNINYAGQFFIKTSGSGFVNYLQYSWPPR
jgi:hypothetical protein